MTEDTTPALLEIERPGELASRVPLGNTTLRIGRGSDSHLHVPEPHVSKHHAEIRCENGIFVVVDMQSRLGVLVNGKRTARHALVDGDLVELGERSPVRITFRAERRAHAEPHETTLVGGVTDPNLGSMARLARFFEFSRKLGGGFSLDEVLRDVVDLAIDVTRAERGVLIVRREDDTLETRVARGKDATELPLDGLKLSETLVRQALLHTRPRVIADFGKDVDLASAKSVVSLELRSAVTLPLLRFEAGDGEDTARGHTFGVLYLDSRRRRGDFDGFDLEILERLARDASAVIENARLMREAETKRRIAQEVRMAREVQSALMPEQFRSTPTFAIAGTCVPCNELGGDYVDQFDLGDGRQALVVADVCGKGVAASLLAAALQGALAAAIGEARPLGEIVARVNRVHSRRAPDGQFITMALALLEPDGTLHWVDAGHCACLHVHARGVTRLAADGIALGLDSNASYRAAALVMAPGDTLVLYSDGVIEGENGARELFGEERLAAVLRAGRTASPEALVASVTRAVAEFRAGAPVSDDLSVLVVRRR